MSVHPYMEPCRNTTRASKDDIKIYITKNWVRNEHERREKPMPHNLTTRFLSSFIRFELVTKSYVTTFSLIKSDSLTITMYQYNTGGKRKEKYSCCVELA